MVKSIGLGLLLWAIALPGFAASWEGLVDWSRRTEMGTAISGVVARVAVKEGDIVKKGGLLLQLEQGALQARLAQYQAEMNHQELLMKEARKELERAKELYARTLLSDHDLNVARIAHAKADAAYKASRADYRQTREDLDNSALHAPYDAVVLARNIHPEQAVISRCEAKPLLVLASSTQFRARIFVERAQLGSLRSGDKVAVEVAGKRYPGKVDAVDYERRTIKEQFRYPVDVVFDTDNILLVGQDAKVSQP